eukprot:symbB.v1.2.004611.t1/scaffold255.1/size249928/1
MLNLHRPGEDDAFNPLYDLPDAHASWSDKGMVKVVELQEPFPEDEVPSQVPPHGCSSTSLHLHGVGAAQAATCVYDFLRTKASASFTKVRPKKFAMKATVFHEMARTLVSCLLKARIFVDPSNGLVVDSDGFGHYLRHFLAHYGHFFRDHQETHLFVYTKLHQEFVENLERAVHVWLTSKDLGDEHLEAMLGYAHAAGDVETSGIVDALTRMLEYHSWIEYIFGLKNSPEAENWMKEQWYKPGWEAIGDSELRWSVQGWEQWTDEEWQNWWSQRREWSDDEWELWYQEQNDWSQSWWDDKQEEWQSKSWSGGYGAGGGYAAPPP